jgi:hypothetical protein
MTLSTVIGMSYPLRRFIIIRSDSHHMSAVSTLDGIKYGFRLMIYVSAIFLISVVVLSAGAASIAASLSGVGSDPELLFIGSVLLIGGLFVLYVGVIASLYKVIADAVTQANDSKETVNRTPRRPKRSNNRETVRKRVGRVHRQRAHK